MDVECASAAFGSWWFREARNRARRSRAGRRASLELIRRDPTLLRRGLYLAAGENVWRHWSTPLPAHLRDTKGFGNRTRGSETGIRGTLRRLRRRAFERLQPPAAFLNRAGNRDGHPIAVSAPGGGVVLFSPDRNLVVRHGTRPVDPEHVALRERFAAHVPSPRFTVGESGWFLVEDLVQGEHVLHLKPDQRVGVAREIFRCYADLVEHQGEGSCEELMTALVAAIEVADVPEGLLAQLDPVPLVELARAWPLVPSATDANPKNVLAVGRGAPMVIDLGSLRLDPFFSFPIGFVELTRGDVLDAYLGGSLDEQIAHLFAAAGAPPLPGEQPRETLLAIRVALVSHRRSLVDGELDVARFGRTLAVRWRNIVTRAPVLYS